MKKVRQHCNSVTLSSYVGPESYFFQKDYSVQKVYLVPFFHAKKVPVELGIFY